MGWNLTDLRPGLANRVYDELARQTVKSVPVPVPPKPESARRHRKPRTNRANDGRAWQNEVLKIAAAYRYSGVLKMEKVDAPNKFIGQRVIPVRNPYPDFVGCWHRNGRMIAVEAKSTGDDRLAIDCKSGGLTTNQCTLLRDWRAAGAIAGVLWRFKTRARWVDQEQVGHEVLAGERALRFDGVGVELVAGMGYVTFDFARAWNDLQY